MHPTVVFILVPFSMRVGCTPLWIKARRMHLALTTALFPVAYCRNFSFQKRKETIHWSPQKTVEEWSARQKNGCLGWALVGASQKRKDIRSPGLALNAKFVSFEVDCLKWVIKFYSKIIWLYINNSWLINFFPDFVQQLAVRTKYFLFWFVSHIFFSSYGSVWAKCHLLKHISEQCYGFCI